MSSLFDENNEEERQEQKLYEFYEVFSIEVRRQLLAKNIPVIQNVYDVLYPQTKNQLLSKNLTSDITIDSTAESVRNALVAKLVEDNINIDTISENFRKQLLSKNVLADSSRELQYKIDKVRQNLLSKNKNTNPNTIDSISESQREELISKNKEPLNIDNDIERDNNYFRENNLTKNSPTESTLNQQSDEFRKNNIHKNVESDSDLERQNRLAREQNLSKNQNSTSNLDSIANEKRDESESKNVSKDVAGLDVQSESFRDNSMSKNAEQTTSLEDSSADIRNNNLSKNDSTDGNLLEDSNNFRKQDLSKNLKSDSDLLSDSQVARDKDLSKNAPKDSNLLESSEEARLNDISKNKESENDLLLDSDIIRKDDLSKNTPSKSDLLADSEDFRADSLINNTPKPSDISLDNEFFRKDNLSKNDLIEGDLKTDSEKYREGDLSKNKPSESDLFSDSSIIRVENTSKNVPTGGDLLTDSEPTRGGLLSQNVPVVTNLENLSQSPREDLLSQNVPNPSDLLDRGIVPRTDLLSQNVPSISDLLIDSEPPREDLLAINIPNTTDLLVDSQSFRDDVISANVPVVTDLLNDSIPYYADNLSANVPTPYDILTASQTYLDSNLSSNNPINSDLLSDSYDTLQDNLAPNVPADSDLLIDSQTYLEDSLASNVPNTSDLLIDSQTYLEDNLASNVPNTSDLLAESFPFRNDLLASNNPIDSDLLNDSSIYRDNLVSQNDNAELGVTFEGAGTFSYLGLSKVALQGLVIRSFLKSKNDYILFKKEYNRSTASTLTKKMDAQGFPLKGYPIIYPDEDLAAAVSRQNLFAENLQLEYGLQDRSSKKSSLGGAYFGVNSLNPQGGSFDSSDKADSMTIHNQNYVGNTTLAIRGYNISRNLYNLNGSQGVSEMSTYKAKLDSNNDLGFQDLIEKTIGSFKTADKSISAQQFGNLIPKSILDTNNHLYLRMSAEEMMKEGATNSIAESMMQKTIAGNPLQEPAFDTGARGVKHIMRTIRNNDKVKMSVNYDPQNTNKYVIKQTKGGTPTYASQKFTIANPYMQDNPPSAKSLIFSLKNYSSGNLMYLPPYIDSFSDSHSANWNEINFLGRPEPIYTYNNSKRDGSISFFVLTDFSQEVLIGRDWNKPDMDQLKFNPLTSFNQKSESSLGGIISDASGLIKKLKDNNDKTEEKADFEAAKNTSTTQATTGATTAADTRVESESAEQEAESSVLADAQASLANQVDVAASAFIDDSNTTYALVGKTHKNIYDFQTSTTDEEGGDLSSTPGDTLKRLDAMAKGTMFQPAFFSGSKVDFLQRMDFLAKLTKPAKASEGSGYSFTSPPVAHIKLGDWWNHDIVVKTVSVDYTDSPWTLDRFGESGVQPLWAKVTLSFDFVGRYGGEGAPVLSTDSGGVYSS